jgi:hypothetical protein
MTVYWLILFFSANNPSPVHVGTFTSMDSCKSAANSAVGIDTIPSGIIGGFTFACVQANENGTSPPP